jgi:hypothetical protein
LEKKVLIISHTFPPSPGVGGRRWAKFAKYLNRQGVNVYVLKEETKELKEESVWIEDINELNANQIFTYKTFYPKILQKKTLSFWDKIQYKIAKWVVAVFTNGNPLDKTIFIKKQFLKQLKIITQTNNINNIIVSGAPFNLLYYSALFKKLNPNINLICDFRDPWTLGQNYGINNVSSRRFSIECEKEKFVVSISDLIFMPTPIMKLKATEKYQELENKIKIITHGFDESNIKIKWSKPNNQILKLAYIGEIYNDIRPYFIEISNVIKQEDLNIKIEFYSSSKKNSELFDAKEFKEKISYFNLLKPSILFKTLLDYNYLLIIHPEYGKNNISTKFYELAYFGIPILYIGEEGMTSDFIKKNNLGIHLTLSEIQTFFSKELRSSEFGSNLIDINNYSLNLISNEIIGYLK